MTLTKTDYLSFKQCSKSFWLRKNKPQLISTEEINDLRLDKGNRITEAARNLFPGGELVSYQENEKMVYETQRLIDEGADILYEGTFEYDDVLVRVDILVKKEHGWDVYEVKSSTKIKERYYDDLAIQAYVLQEAGFQINHYHILHLNNQYTKRGELDLHSLFSVENVTQKISSKLPLIKPDILSMKKIVSQTEGKYEIGMHCEKFHKEDFPCAFMSYCWRDIPDYSVFNITSIGKKKV